MLLRICFLLFSVGFSVSTQAQPGFNKIYDFDLPTNHFRKLIVDNDTIIAYAMAFTDSVPTGQGLLLAKMDSAGQVISYRLLQDSLDGILSVDFSWGQMIKTADGDYAFTAVNLSRGYSWLVEIDKNLETKRIYEFADTVDKVEFYDNIIQLSDGYLISGFIQRQNLKIDGFARRIDKAGNTLWFKYYGQYNADESIQAMVRISDNRFVLGGSVGPDFNNSETARAGLWVIDTNGNVVKTWVAPDEPDLIVIRTLLSSPDEGLIAHGRIYLGEGQWGSRVQETLLKFDSTLQVEWMRQVGPVTSNVNSFWDMAATPDGHYIAAGSRTTYFDPLIDDGDWGGWLFKFTEQGDSLWSLAINLRHEFSTATSHIFGGVGTLSSGNIIAGGQAIINGQYVGWVVKVTAEGCLDTIFCNIVPAVEPPLAKEDLLKIWPNPADESIQLEMSRGIFWGAMITLFNLQGQMVQRQAVAENQEMVVLHTASLPDGVYFVEVRSGRGAVARKKIVVAH